MPTHDDISRLSITQLAWVAQCAKETASKRLREAGVEPVGQDGRTIYYDPRFALPVLLGVGEGLSPTAEKARLDKARADLAELELATKRGELVDAADPDHGYVALATLVSARLQGVGSAIATELAAASKPARCQEIVDEAIHEALNDLAEAGEKAAERLAARAAEDRARGSDSVRRDEAGAAPERPRVGREVQADPHRNEPKGGKVA